MYTFSLFNPNYKKKNYIQYTSLTLLVFFLLSFPFASTALAKEDTSVKTIQYGYIPYAVDESYHSIITLLTRKKTKEADQLLKEKQKENKSSLQLALIETLVLDQEKGKQYTLDMLTKKIQANKKDWKPYVVRGFFLLEKKYYTTARADFQKANKLTKQNQELVFLGLSLSYESLNQLDKATTTMRILVSLQKEKTSYWYSLALLLIQRVKNNHEASLKLTKADITWLREAKEAAKTAYHLDSKDSRIYKLYASILDSLGTHEEKENLLKEIVKTNKSSVWARLELVALYLRKKDFKQAKIWLDEAKEEAGETFAINYSYGEWYKQQHKNVMALAWLQKAYKQDPNSVQVSLALSMLYLEEQRTKEAIPYLKQVAKKHLPFLFIYTTLAKHYLVNGDYTALEDVLQTGLQLDKNNVWLLTYYSQLYEIRNQSKKAVELYYKIQKLYGKNEYILGRLGDYYASKKNYEKALHYFTLALQEGGNEIWLQQGHVMALVGLHRYDKALKEVAKIKINKESKLFVSRVKALIYYHTNKFALAKKEIDKLTKKERSTAFYTSFESLLLIRLHNKKEAVALLDSYWKDSKKDSIFLGIELALNLPKEQKAKALRIVTDLLNEYGPNVLLLTAKNKLEGNLATVWGLRKQSKELQTLQYLLDYSFAKADAHMKTLRKKGSLYVPYLVFLHDLLEIQLNETDIPSFSKKIAHNAWLAYVGMSYWQVHQNEQKANQWLLAANRNIKDVKKGNNIWIKSSLSFYYDKQDQQKKNVAILEEFVKNSSLHEWAKIRLAYAYSQTQQQKKAEATYLSLLDENPNSAIVLNNLAWFYVSDPLLYVDKKDKAVSLSKKAVDLDPSLANVDTLARAYFWAGKNEKALSLVREFEKHNYQAQQIWRKLKKDIIQKIEDESKKK